MITFSEIGAKSQITHLRLNVREILSPGGNLAFAYPEPRVWQEPSSRVAITSKFKAEESVAPHHVPPKHHLQGSLVPFFTGIKNF